MKLSDKAPIVEIIKDVKAAITTEKKNKFEMNEKTAVLSTETIKNNFTNKKYN